jgi:hypothetical protein
MLDALRYVSRQLWRWEVVGLLATAVFAAAGLGAIYGEQFTLAAICFSVSVALVVFKTLSWEEVRRHTDRVWISFLTVALGLIILGVALYWVQYRIGAKKNPATDPQKAFQPAQTPFKSEERQAPAAATLPPVHPPLKREPKVASIVPNVQAKTANPRPPDIKQDCVGSNCIAGDSYGTNTVINEVPQPLQFNRIQGQRIAEGMASYKGISVDLQEDGLTAETRNLAEGLKQALTDSGLNVSLTSAVMNFPLGPTMRLQPGLTFCIGSDEETAAQSLANLLRNTGVLPEGRTITLIRDPRNSSRFMIGISPSH